MSPNITSDTIWELWILVINWKLVNIVQKLRKVLKKNSSITKLNLTTNNCNL